MRLGINGWRLQGARTGVARYLHNVLRYWTADVADGRFDEITLYTPKPVDRRETSVPVNIRERVVGPQWRMLAWENIRLASVATDDILFCPSYSVPLAWRGRAVVTTHEATVVLHPELYPRSARLFYARLYGVSARRATLVVTHTEGCRDDIARCYGVPPSRIRVVPLAPAQIFRPLDRADPALEQVRRRYLDSAAPFFLYVGKLSGRRNVPKLIEAFGELKRRTGWPHKLLVVGLNTTELQIDALARAFDIAADFRHVEYVGDEDLNLLYNAADAFVLPHTYEAVSLTALEAQVVGTPVITTESPGLREITGGAALLMRRAEVPEIVEAMMHIGGDVDLRRDLGERGQKHAQRFSWERTSRETLAVLEEAARLPARAARASVRGQSG